VVTYYLFRLGELVGPFVPIWLGFTLCDIAGWLVFWLLPSKRRAVLCNLAHVLPDATPTQRNKIAQQMIQGNLKNFFDLSRAHKMTPAQFDAQVTVVGLENVREAEKRGKGIIVFSGHVGSFSFVSQVATRVQIHFNLTVEPVKPLKLFELVRRLREVDPQTKLISIAGSELRNVFRALKRNEMVCLAIDRDVIGNGVPQVFFGRPALLPTGAAEIALRTGASVMPVLCYRTPDRRNVLVFKPGFVLETTKDHAADVIQGNARLLREVEKMIRDRPDQWVGIQPIWDDCK